MGYTSGIGLLKLPDDQNKRWYAFRHDDPEARYAFIGDTAKAQLPKVKALANLMKTGSKEEIYRNIDTCIEFPKQCPPGMRQAVSDEIYGAAAMTLGPEEEIVASEVSEGADVIWDVLEIVGDALLAIL